jgi:hypothetical protein
MTAEDSTRMLADMSELIIGTKDVPDSVSAAAHDLFPSNAEGGLQSSIRTEVQAPGPVEVLE